MNHPHLRLNGIPVLWIAFGALAISHTNGALAADPSTNATTADEARVFDMQGKEQVVRAAHSDGPYRRFVPPAVEPWTMRLVVVGPP